MSAAAVPGLSQEVLSSFMSLPLPEDVIQAEYVWIGGTGLDVRCKTRTLKASEYKGVESLPVWNYDGSSTGQAPGKDSEVYIRPVAVYPDPFRRGKHILVLCETCLPDKALTPIPTNTRRRCAEIMDKAKDQEPWFGLEQEFTLFHEDGRTPLGWPRNGFPAPQGPYYCSAGADVAFGRAVVEAHYRCCLYAGIKISGCNAEVMPGQWEYQVGPCVGIECGDQVTMSRYLLQRVGEAFNVRVSFAPKPIPGDWNGAGLHCNYSTKAMRAEGGMKVIKDAVEKLSKRHAEHIAVYGEDNNLRLTGAHETAPIDKFTAGVADRGASIRIPRTTAANKRGYLEDRRPASNADPYLVSGIIVETTCLDGGAGGAGAEQGKKKKGKK